MKTQFEIYLTISLIAFAFTAEVATILLKNQEKTSVSTKTAHEAATKTLQKSKEFRSERDSLGMDRKDFDCLENEDFFRSFKAERKARAPYSSSSNQGSQGRKKNKKIKKNGKKYQSRDLQTRRQKPRREECFERTGKPKVLRQSRNKNKNKKHRGPKPATLRCPIMRTEKQEAPERTKMTQRAVKNECAPEKEETKPAKTGKNKDQKAQDAKNLQAATAPAAVCADCRTLKAKIVSQPKEQIIESILPDGGKAVHRIFRSEINDVSKPGEKSSRRAFRTFNSENFKKFAKSSDSSDSSKPHLDIVMHGSKTAIVQLKATRTLNTQIEGEAKNKDGNEGELKGQEAGNEEESKGEDENEEDFEGEARFEEEY
jgi:hypothetical protein